MRVLVAHNFYRSEQPSGENAVVASEIASLRTLGIDVLEYLESSDEIGNGSIWPRLNAAVGPVLSVRGVSRLRGLIAKQSPDLLHIHNVYPLISPAVVNVAFRSHLPVVQTVHNYRHSCVKGTHFREGRICESCLGRTFSGPAILHGCYRDSHTQSLPMAVGQFVHRHTWSRVTEFVALSQFMREHLISIGIDQHRISVRPTHVGAVRSTELPAGKVVMFAGRLDEEKGIELLLRSWLGSELRADGWKLRVVGSGPCRDLVDKAASSDPSIDFCGRVAGAEMGTYYDSARLVVLPSLWFEGYPKVLAEALAHGRPVMASNIGSLGTEVHSNFGWKVEPTVEGWTRALSEATLRDIDQKALAARREWSRRLQQHLAMQQLKDIYERVAERSTSR